MFPIIWRFLVQQYLKVTVLCIATIILILLITRLEDIAHFASLDASFKILLLFILHQIPYILPIAIPIACLISSILLVQRLSKTHELTALRACGMALKDFIAPILIAGAFFSVVNFYVVSELATDSHLNTNLWKSELRSINPLLLLKNKHLLKINGAYFDTLGPSQVGESASQVVAAMPNSSNGNIILVLAEKMEGDKDTLISEGVTLLTAIDGKDPEGVDHLVIENVETSRISAQAFSQLIQRRAALINNDHLRMPLLLSRLNETRQSLKHDLSHAERKQEQRNINEIYSEIVRRIFAALAAFTFTLMGTSFGISISRNHSNRAVGWVILIVAIYLTTYFAAKGASHHPILSLLLYSLPHVLIIGLSIWMLKRVSKGIDRG